MQKDSSSQSRSRKSNVRVMTGNEACAEGALAAGLSFFAGYPITPSSEIAEVLSAYLPQRGGKFMQMEDEISAMGAIIGASLTGAKSMTATSGPGFSLKQENIGYASISEVPCVIVNVMRGGPSTGLPTLAAQADVMQARWGTHGDHPIIVLAATSVLDVYLLTIRAFNLAERYRVPVILLLDEIIGHTSEKVILPDPETIEIWNRVKPTVPPEDYLPYEVTASDIPPMACFGNGYRFHVTGLVHDETGFPTNARDEIVKFLSRLNRKIDRYADEIITVNEDFEPGAKIGIFAYGSSARSAKRAVFLAREQGMKVDFLNPTVLWPFPEKHVVAMANRVDTIIVPEMNLGQMAHEVEWAVRGNTTIVKVNRIDGEPIKPDEILKVLVENN